MRLSFCFTCSISLSYHTLSIFTFCSTLLHSLIVTSVCDIILVTKKPIKDSLYSHDLPHLPLFVFFVLFCFRKPTEEYFLGFYRMYNAADSRQSRTAETLGFNVLDNQVPITELPNTLSIDIDIASPECKSPLGVSLFAHRTNR